MIEQEFDLNLTIKDRVLKRIKDLKDNTLCIKCVNLEHNSTEGIFYSLCFAHNKHGRKSMTHSKLLDCFYILMLIVYGLLTLLFIFHYNKHWIMI